MRPLTEEDVRGVLAIMPTPATPDASDPAVLDTVDHAEAARAADALVSAGVDVLTINGTFGEGATLTWKEHEAFAATVIDAVAGRVPVVVGATTLNTRDTIMRARRFAELGAAGIMLGRPMWSPCDEDTTVRFYSEVAEAVPEVGVVVYDNPVAFRGKVTPSMYARIAEIPTVVAAKYPNLGGSLLADVAAVAGRMAILPVDREWYYAQLWAPDAIVGCWSGAICCGPAPVLELRDRLARGDLAGARRLSEGMRGASRTFFPKGSFELFSNYNVQLEKIRIDAAGYMSAGPGRPPYSGCPEEYAEGARISGRNLARLHAEVAASRSAS